MCTTLFKKIYFVGRNLATFEYPYEVLPERDRIVGQFNLIQTREGKVSPFFLIRTIQNYLSAVPLPGGRRRRVGKSRFSSGRNRGGIRKSGAAPRGLKSFIHYHFFSS